MVEQSARLPAVLSNHLGNDILMDAQAPRVMPLHGFHSEFGGPGPESYMGNFADDAEHVEHKLRLPVWLDQTNLQLNHPLGAVPGNSSVFSPGTTTLPERNNIFGTSSSQAQWVNYRYPEASFACASSVSMPHGLKVEQEENKGELSHCVSSLYPSHMEPTRMSGSSIFDNSSFGLLDPNMSSTSSNNRINVVEIQKIFKQGNQAENFMVNSQASSGFSLSCRKSLEHMVMPRMEEWGSGEAEIMEKQVRSSSNTEEHLTKDFMGVGDGSLSREMGPVMNLQSQFHGHY